jgi:asparagine synthetase B (glutamine-hydrolysing)
MCGIAGWLGVSTDSETHAAKLMKALRYRGPDDQGIQIWPEATLVHTRLSIIDLSAAGAHDTSLFAVNAICRLMRRYVTVAISGDGGDEAFGGYDIYWRLARIARWQMLPSFFMAGAGALSAVPWFGISTRRLSHRLYDLAAADDISVIQSLFA